MINGKKVLAVIPARGGSKGIPQKNIVNLFGKPLIAWTIEEAKKSKYIDRLILSSDDRDIIETAKKYDCEVPFVRPEELSTDEAKTIDVLLHALYHVSGYDYIVLLQPTSPLRKVIDIDQAIEKANPVSVTLTENDKSPFWMYTCNEQQMTPILSTDNRRRQDQSKTYVLNGAVYVSEVNYFKHHKTFVTEDTVPVIMPKDRSIDIDYKLDLMFAELILKHNQINV